MSALRKYVLLQVPGWLLAGALLAWVWPSTGWSPVVAVLLLALWVGKDFALWPWLRGGYESGVPTGPERLVGAVGVTRDRLERRGWIRVHGELWRAELVSGEAPLPAGTEVRVVRTEGMTLFVAGAGGADSKER